MKKRTTRHLRQFCWILFLLTIYALPTAVAADGSTTGSMENRSTSFADDPFVDRHIVLTDDSLPVTIASGEVTRVTGSSGINTLNVPTGARVECRNFIGANVFYFEEPAEHFTIYRSGASAYLESTAGTLVKLPATATGQTLHFSDGTHDLVISLQKMMLGNQIVNADPAPAPPPAVYYDEVEFNGNMGDANVLSGYYPYVITGALAPGNNYSVDDDYFEFTAVSGDLITLSILKTSSDFNPSLSLVDSTGLPISVISHPIAHGEAISVRIPEDGSYYAVVSEKDNMADESFTYKLEIFLDSDMDGLSDAFERFMGLDPENPDSDGDGLSDGVEYSYAADNPDPDLNGLQAWWDTDADGDGIPDFIEGVGDVDEDGIPNFLDLDSDGNGIPDAVEAGPDPLEPLDTDGDGIYDFLDTDDDGDGLLDTTDPQRTVHARQSDLLDIGSRVYLLSFESIITGTDGNTHTIREIARTGDELKISGEGFEPGRTLVILDTLEGPRNITPAGVSSNEVTITIPEKTLSGPLRVAVNGVLSNPLSLEIVSSSHPIIYSVSHSGNNLYAMPGETLTIAGENLDADSSNVLFSGITEPSGFATESTVTVTVPDDARTGDIRVSALGISNPVPLLIRTEVFGRVELPTDSTLSLSDLEIEFADSVNPVSYDGTFTLPVLNQGTSSITIFMPSVSGQHDPAVFLSATVLAGDTGVTVSPASTAADLVFSAMGLETLIHPDDLKTALDLVEGATGNLAAYLNDALGADPYFMEEYTRSDLADEILSGIQAAAPVLEAGIASGTIRTADQEPSPMLYGSATPQVTPAQSQYDFVVSFLGDPINGQIRLENDTMLFSDVQIKNAYNDKDIKKFTNAYFSSALLGPQGGWKTLYWGNSADYDLAYKTADIFVRTPGLVEMGSWSDYYYSPSFKLALRTLLSQAVVPVVTTVVGVHYSDTKTELILKILFDYGVFDGVADYWFSGDFLGGVGAVIKKTVSKHILEDLVEALVKAIFSADNVQEQIIKLAAKLGLKLTPWGQAATVVSVGGTVVDLGKLATDVVTTPSELRFRAVFPITIEAVEPTAIKRNEGDQQITLRGQGLAPFNFGTFFKERYEPSVLFEDADGNIYDETSPRMGSFWVASGTRVPYEELWCTLPMNWIKDAVSPVTATLNHHHIDYQWFNQVNPVTLEAPYQIQIVDELTLSSITPDKGGANTRVTLKGAGFSEKISENLVFFTGQSGTLAATVESASSATIAAVVPRGVATGNVWVEVDGEQSNPVTFSVEEEIYAFTFGDNGNLNDDTFALYVNGALVRTMTAPARSVTGEIPLSPGRHSVSMRGITAPDEIGTYYINMPAGVRLVSGDATSGRDMTAGVTRSWIIEVSDSPPVSQALFSTSPVRMIYQAE